MEDSSPPTRSFSSWFNTIFTKKRCSAKHNTQEQQPIIKITPQRSLLALIQGMEKLGMNHEEAQQIGHVIFEQLGNEDVIAQNVTLEEFRTMFPQIEARITSKTAFLAVKTWLNPNVEREMENNDVEEKSPTAAKKSWSTVTLPKFSLLKIVLLGDAGTGKTELMHRFCEDRTFSPTYVKTFAIKLKAKQVELRSSKIHFTIWDTAGEALFFHMTKFYYRGSNVVILTFDMTRHTSLLALDKFVPDVKAQCINGSRLLPIALVGTKCDCVESREITMEDAQKWAANHDLIGSNVLYFETSAKDNINVHEMFMTAAEAYYARV